MIKWEQIKKVNEEISTIDVKGKNYAEVNQRIKAFRMLYPEGFILSEIKSLENGVCVIQAEVGYYSDNGTKVILGTGTAYEKEGSTFINKTSYIENCETSAVGRALGMMGLGIDVSIASAEEVQTAIINQTPQAEPKITEVDVKALTARCKEDKVSVEKLCALYKVKEFKDLTVKMYTNMNKNWEKVKENCNE